MRKQIERLNEFGFKNGVQGLADMVRKSTEFRQNMQDVFTIADKVMNPEGAIDLSANLQVLGGVIGDFNDPLKLMYMATNNVEGLQDALNEAAKSLATYNTQQGRFEITGINLRRANEMAKILGINMGDLTKNAIAAAERSQAASDLLIRGLQMNPEDKEFLTNIAQMKGGRMVITVPDSLRSKLNIDANEIALNQLNQKQAEQILLYKKDLESKTPEDILRGQASDIANIGRDISYIAQLLRVQMGSASSQLYKQVSSLFGTGPDAFKKFSEKTLGWTKEAPSFVNDVTKNVGSDFSKIINGVKETVENVGNLKVGDKTLKETIKETGKDVKEFWYEGKDVFEKDVWPEGKKAMKDVFESLKGYLGSNIQNPKLNSVNKETEKISTNTNNVLNTIDKKSISKIEENMMPRKNNADLLPDKKGRKRKLEITHTFLAASSIFDGVQKQILHNPQIRDTWHEPDGSYTKMG
jgi:hypothetical protein